VKASQTRTHFQRHLAAHGTDPADAKDPFRPGDVIFMDTLPGKPGPDHVGIINVFHYCAYLPLIGLLTVFLPDLKRARTGQKA